MAESAPSTSPLLRFFDAFLQERNIKWVLTAGLAILLGSSAMMVTSHWDSLEGGWRYVILLGYVAAIHLAGQWTYHHLALRKTGTALMGLTVLLVPLSFVAWHWLVLRGAADAAGFLWLITMPLALGLLAANTAFSAAASRRIFRHLLSGTQRTFVVSYLLLALAGAMGPSVAELGDVASWAASGTLWLVFCVGATKVNRHVFWLVERRQSPRVAGFLPVLLLGGQFLGLFAAHFLPHVTLPWIGFGLVLFSIPVLLTADAVADVFQQRTGNLVRPLPWAIALPITLGTACCLSGVAFAAQAIFVPPHLPFALVPTAILAAVVMGLVARRTGQSRFVWLMLAAIVIGYNFSPVFFRELAKQTLHLGAVAVGESRLPYAFYGLTYVPLIGGLMAAAAIARRRGSALFAAPARRLAIGLSAVLMLASFTHPQGTLYPVFLVGGVMTVVFAVQCRLFADRRIAVASVLAYLAAAAGCAAFGRQVWQMPLWPSADLLGFTVATAVLLVAGRWLDRRLGMAVCQVSSLVAAVGAAIYWLGHFGFTSTPDHAWGVAGLIGGLLVAQSMKWLSTSVSTITYAFAATAGILGAVSVAMPIRTLTGVATLVLLAQWALDYVFAARPEARVARAFGVVNRFTSCGGLTLLLLLVYLPALAVETAWAWEVGLSRGMAALVAAWAFDAARRFQFAALTVGGSCGVLALASAALVQPFGPVAHVWLPAAWATMALATLPGVEMLRRRTRVEAIHVPLHGVTWLLLGTTAIACLFWWSWPIRVAGLVGAVGLFVVGRLRGERSTALAAGAVGNWHLILAAAMFEWFGAGIATQLVLALSATVSLLIWQNRRLLQADEMLGNSQRGLLCLLACLGLMISLDLPALSTMELALAGMTFGLLVLSECRSALRTQDESRVWMAGILILAGIGFFAWFHAIHFGRGLAMCAVLLAGFVSFAISRAIDGRPSWSVFTQPLRRTGWTLPLVAAGIAVGRHLFYAQHGIEPAWFGMNSLTMFFAAGFYFWQGLEARQVDRRLHSGCLVLAAVLVNSALALLWHDLAWTDPQLFLVPIGASVLLLVELLRAEIPRDLHDPLRYAGALVVLVSPTFDILGGSWLHLLTLMVLSVAVLLMAIGIRVRVLTYMGLGFLIADLVAMVVRGSVDHPDLLWVAGIAVGVAVVTLAAVCENHRERLLQRMRAISAELETWN